MDRCGEILKADCLHNGCFQKYSRVGSRADRGLGGTPRRGPRPTGPAIQAERCLYWAGRASSDARRVSGDVHTSANYWSWLLKSGYPPFAASLGCNDVVCWWKFIGFGSRDNRLLQCYDSLFLWARLTLFSTLWFQNTHLNKCWIAQKNAKDLTVRWRRVPGAGLRSRKNTYQDGSSATLCTADQHRQKCRFRKIQENRQLVRADSRLLSNPHTYCKQKNTNAWHVSEMVKHSITT